MEEQIQSATVTHTENNNQRRISWLDCKWHWQNVSPSHQTEIITYRDTKCKIKLTNIKKAEILGSATQNEGRRIWEKKKKKPETNTETTKAERHTKEKTLQQLITKNSVTYNFVITNEK